MPISHVVVLSLIQGLTEFLPISSSGHLLLLPQVAGWADQGLNFDASIHLGTLFAVLVYFYKDIRLLVRSLFVKEEVEQRKLVGLLLLSSVPAMIVGLIFKSWIEDHTRSLLFVIFNLFFWGIVLILAEWYAHKRTTQIQMTGLSWKKSLLIGAAQALALLPGTSRSGITITAGLFSSLTREEAVRFSFLMGIPVIAGAGLLSLIDLLGQSQEMLAGELLFALFLSFVSGLFAIHLLLKLISKKGLYFFGLYRILLAILLYWFFV